MVRIAEVCTGEASNLSIAAKSRGVKYAGFGLFNKTNLNTKFGYNKVRKHNLKHKPTFAMLSPQCAAFSVAQNGNRRTPKQRNALKLKRKKDSAMFTNTCLLATELRRKAVTVVAEQPQRCHSWKRTDWKHMRELLPHSAYVLGCQVGLRTQSGELMSKVWTFRSDNPIVTNDLAKFSKCTCPSSVLPHGKCTKVSELYPPTLCQQLVRSAMKIPAAVNTEAPIPSGLLGKFAASQLSWKRENASRTPVLSRSTQKLCGLAGRKAQKRTKAVARKRCRKLSASCAGGLSVAPKLSDDVLRECLVKKFGKVRVYCRLCLRMYRQRIYKQRSQAV